MISINKNKIVQFFRRPFEKWNKRHTFTDKSTSYAEFLLDEKKYSVMDEAFRMTRTNLMYVGCAKKRAVCFGITSGRPNEGKSLTCANLAISFAMAGKHTLIIDCDMRNATQHRIFEKNVTRGLSEYLAGLCEEPDVLRDVRPSLSVIPAGQTPPNPAELLYNGRLDNLIKQYKYEYDYIFIDLPPISLVSDATIVSALLDGYVFVVQSGVSERKTLEDSLAQVEAVKGNIVGFILNAVMEQDGKGYGKYGRYGYGTPAPEKTEERK